MNLQLKFRAWDSEQSKMIYCFDGEYEIMVNSEDGTVFCGGHLPNGDWNEPVLMLFTGISTYLDEIFDGDIVRFKGGILDLLVQYENGGFYLYHFNGLKDSEGLPYRWGPLYRAIELNKELIVVGNVYEGIL